MNKIETSTAEMHIDDDGILHLKIKKNATVTLPAIKENYSSIEQLLGKNQILLLIDARVKYKFTKEARKLAAGNSVGLNRIATAFVVNSFIGRIIASVYIGFNRPIVPTQIFNSKEKALIWLKSFYILPGTPFVKQPKK